MTAEEQPIEVDDIATDELIDVVCSNFDLLVTRVSELAQRIVDENTDDDKFLDRTFTLAIGMIYKDTCRKVSTYGPMVDMMYERVLLDVEDDV